MDEQKVIEWLLKGDVSIRYQATRDLLGSDNKDLQKRIASEGWGKQLLSKRKAHGHWGDRFYQPKWTSTHYTLLDLRNLNLSPDNPIAKEAIEQTLQAGKADDGGIPLGPTSTKHSDVCVNGMFLNYASYFKTDEKKLQSVLDSILQEIMPDGGFNCRTARSGARHSSLHSTISVLEGFFEFIRSGSTYRLKDIQKARKSSEEFILIHQLFLSDRSGKIIHNDFLKMSYPFRWKYNILRAMDYFQYSGRKWDSRMEKALNVIRNKRNKDGTWNMQAAHPGKVHFVMEKAGKPGRWNTLMALRIGNTYDRA